FGTDVMCPAQQVAPPPPPTTTQPPVVTTTTTTTVPYIPPTTTTLPPLGPWSGVWDFYGTIYQSDCPAGTPYALSETYAVEQGGLYFAAKVGSLPGVVLTGDIDEDGGFTVVGDFTQNGCAFRTVLATTPTGTIIVSTEPASAGLHASCPAGSCTVIYAGLMD